MCRIQFMLLIVSVSVAFSSKIEKQLLDDLFAHYDPIVRPVANHSENVTLTADFSPIKIIDFDLDDLTMSINGWMRFTWNDVNMKWNASQYGGIEILRVPMDRLWKPDARIYNAIEYEVEDTLALVYNTGNVMQVPPITATLYCFNASARWFPFDKHTCTVRIGSWTYDAHKLDIQADNKQIEDYFSADTEWELLGVVNTRTVKHYPCCPEPYASVDSSMTIRRKPCKYVVNIFLPVLATVILALMTTIIPAERADVRLIIVTLLTGTCAIHLGLSKEYIPQSLTVLDIINAQMMLILGALIFCNCIHLAVLNKTIQCSFMSKINHIVSARISGKQDDEKASSTNPLVQNDEERRCHGLIDRLSTAFLTIYAFGITTFITVVAMSG